MDPSVRKAMDRAAEKVEPRPLTPRSARPRSTWGSLLMQVPSRGLCPKGRCLRKDSHEGVCWPNKEA